MVIPEAGKPHPDVRLCCGASADKPAESRMTSSRPIGPSLNPRRRQTAARFADLRPARAGGVLCRPIRALVGAGQFSGMYGNHDGHWASWSARGILEWGGFLDFSPVSPLTGTGSPFLPNLPWLNPGSLALAIPAPLPVQHLASMLIYLAELSASLYLLYRHLEFSREQSFLATILYICIFFIPLNGYTLALPWYALAPINAHLIAAMNVATIALIRVGYERIAFKLLYGFVFVAALFVAFASAPDHLDDLCSRLRGIVACVSNSIPSSTSRHVVAMGHYRIRFARTGIDRSTVLSGRYRHDVGTRGLCAADVPSRLAAVVAGILAGAPIDFPFARTTCN